MELRVKGNFRKGVLIVLAVGVYIALAVWISKTYLAGRAAEKPTRQDLQLAVKYDPSNSSHHLRLARIFQYSLTDIDPERAIDQLRRATELNPYSAEPWVDLAAALEFQGKVAEAEACLRRADFLAPRIPRAQWAIGNFFLLHGNVDEAFRHFRVVLAGSTDYNQALFNTAWKASGDATKILEELIPRDIPTEFSYLNFLVQQEHYTEAQSVWKRIGNSPEDFPPTQAAAYINSLIRARRPTEAYQVWTDLIRRGLIKSTYEASPQNLIVNGDFEENLLEMSFDWQLARADGVFAGLDRTTFHSPSFALLIQFMGESNINYGHTLQYVKVDPRRRYRLQGYMKSEDITTDSGPRLEVRDAYDMAALNLATEGLTGTSMGWTPLTLDFVTGPDTELIIVRVARRPSRKLDNLISGKVWVDDIALTPQ